MHVQRSSQCLRYSIDHRGSAVTAVHVEQLRMAPDELRGMHARLHGAAGTPEYCRYAETSVFTGRQQSQMDDSRVRLVGKRRSYKHNM